MEHKIQKYCGNMQQLFSMRRVKMQEGSGKGASVIEVSTAGGLQVDILPDTGLDIGQVRFNGKNVSFITKNGYDSQARFNPYGNEFMHTFSGGLLYTCGLRSTGPTNLDNEEYHPLHGRYHGLCVNYIGTEIVDDNMIITGTMQETALFGAVLEVKRKITIPCVGSEIAVEDTLTNKTHKDEEIMLLYHCNFGYPLLSENAKLILPKERTTTPRTEFAKTGMGQECEFTKPVDGEEERVFFHQMQEYWAYIENTEENMAVKMEWSGDTLPILAQWKSMASGDYVLGLEPTNSYIMGRNAERENSTLPILKGYGQLKTKIKFIFTTV